VIKIKKRFRKVIMMLMVCVGIFTIMPKNIVQAAAAPPLTNFSIIGYSWPDLYQNTGNFYDRSDTSSAPVLSSTVYLIAEETGYAGQKTVKVDGVYYPNDRLIDKIAASYDSTGAVTGWYDVIAIDNISNGSH